MDLEEDFTKWLCVIGRFETCKVTGKASARNRLVLAENLVNLIADEGPGGDKPVRYMDRQTRGLHRQTYSLAKRPHQEGLFP